MCICTVRNCTHAHTNSVRPPFFFLTVFLILSLPNNNNSNNDDDDDDENAVALIHLCHAGQALQNVCVFSVWYWIRLPCRLFFFFFSLGFSPFFFLFFCLKGVTLWKGGIFTRLRFYFLVSNFYVTFEYCLPEREWGRRIH